MKSKLLVAISTLLVIGFAQASQARTCESAFVPTIANPFFKQSVEDAKGAQRLLNLAADSISIQLSQGGSDWKPVDSNLVEVVSRALSTIPENNLGLVPLYRVEKELKPYLQISKDFKHLQDDELAQALALISGRDSSVSGKSVSTVHLIAEVRYLLSEPKSNELAEVIAKGHAFTERLREMSSRIAALTHAGNNPLFESVRSIEDLKALKAKLQSEYDDSRKVPEHVISSLVAVALEMENGNRGNTDFRTPEHKVAEAKFQSFVASEPFFANARADERYHDSLEHFMNWGWKNCVDRESAEEALKQLVVQTNQSKDVYDQLREIDDILSHFGI